MWDSKENVQKKQVRPFKQGYMINDDENETENKK